MQFILIITAKKEKKKQFICQNIKKKKSKLTWNAFSDFGIMNVLSFPYKLMLCCFAKICWNTGNYQASFAGGNELSIFDGINMLKPSAAVDMSIPGICVCQWSSFKSFWP